MPRDAIDFSTRAQLAELMDEPCSREELRACLRDLALVNRWLLAYRPLLTWLDSMAEAIRPLQPVRILDAGCGYGDGLRRIERWARERKIEVELTGLDLNPMATEIAGEATPATSAIRWITCDVLAYQTPQPLHLVVSSLFTHHLAEPDIVRFMEWMERNAIAGWFINDLSRAAIPYYLFSALARVARLHRFVQHDGPVSIARSFRPEDWQRMCRAAGLGAGDVEIQSFTPGRLCVARRKLR